MNNNNMHVQQTNRIRRTVKCETSRNAIKKKVGLKWIEMKSIWAAENIARQCKAYRRQWLTFFGYMYLYSFWRWHSANTLVNTFRKLPAGKDGNSMSTSPIQTLCSVGQSHGYYASFRSYDARVLAPTYRACYAWGLYSGFLCTWKQKPSCSMSFMAAFVQYTNVRKCNCYHTVQKERQQIYLHNRSAHITIGTSTFLFNFNYWLVWNACLWGWICFCGL